MVGPATWRISSAVVSLRASSESSCIISSQDLVFAMGGERSFRSPRSGELRRGETEEEEGLRFGLEDRERELVGLRHGTFHMMESSGRSSSSSSYSASSSFVVFRLPLGCQEERLEASIGELSECRRGERGEGGARCIGELWILDEADDLPGDGLGGESDCDGLDGDRIKVCRGEGGCLALRAW